MQRHSEGNNSVVPANSVSVFEELQEFKLKREHPSLPEYYDELKDFVVIDAEHDKLN